jgi:uncharacterized protein YejL (UPF0352 family)
VSFTEKNPLATDLQLAVSGNMVLTFEFAAKVINSSVNTTW